MTTMNREKLADLTSSTGALILGVGIGIYLAGALDGTALWFLLLGALLHGWGMFDKHKSLIAATASPPLWWRALYGVCWIGLALLLVYAVIRA
jgi:hypothetical protein